MNKIKISIGIGILLLLIIFLIASSNITGMLVNDANNGVGNNANNDASNSNRVDFGSYSFIPSFSIPFNNKLNIWDSLIFEVFDNPSGLLQGIKSCENGGKELKECVNMQIEKSNKVLSDIELSEWGCSSSEAGRYQMMDQLESCSRSSTDCDCKIALDRFTKKNFVIKVIATDVIFEFENREILLDNLQTPQETINGIMKSELWFKKDDNGLSSQDKPDNPNLCKDLSRTKIFCAQSKETAVWKNYDGNVEKKLLKTYFALQFTDNSPPPPITGLNVKDLSNAERSVVVSFDKSVADDISSYTIFIGGDLNRDTSLLLLDESIKTKKFQANDEISELVQELYLEKDKIYYKENKFTIIIPVKKDNTPYDFGVIAEDEYGNKISNIGTQVIPRKTEKSIDDLAPNPVRYLTDVSFEGNTQLSWNTPTENEDGTTINPEDLFFDVYLDNNLLSTINFISSSCSIDSLKCDITISANIGQIVKVIAKDSADNKASEAVLTIN